MDTTTPKTTAATGLAAPSKAPIARPNTESSKGTRAARASLRFDLGAAKAPRARSPRRGPRPPAQPAARPRQCRRPSTQTRRRQRARGGTSRQGSRTSRRHAGIIAAGVAAGREPEPERPERDVAAAPRNWGVPSSQRGTTAPRPKRERERVACPLRVACPRAQKRAHAHPAVSGSGTTRRSAPPPHGGVSSRADRKHPRTSMSR